jgi:hypothetical protein
MVTVWTVVLVVGCVAMVGLVLDGGTLLRARSSTYDLAAEAARDGAQQLAAPALVDGHVEIDPDTARAAVVQFLAARDATGRVTVDGDRLTVVVTRRVQLQILRPATVTVVESATVQAHRGPP